MKLKYITENEKRQYTLMFNTMNSISNITNLDNYVESKIQRYKIVAQIFNKSIETIRKIFQNTYVSTWRTYKQYKVELKFYDVDILLKRLNKKRFDAYSIKVKKEYQRYQKLGQYLRKILKILATFVSAKTLSKILKTKYKLLNIFIILLERKCLNVLL